LFAGPDLAVSASASSDTVNAGADLIYTINVNNPSAAQATGVTLVDTLPAGAAFVSATGGSRRWQAC
jgi:uncharacterized repeat protein (TIGR01451 family)